MIISDLYQTKIEASNYNVNIDSTDTVITVSLIDFNGNAVTGKSVTLACDKGYFNKNGSTTISGTTTKSITATTDSNGKITATWTASEWELCTFTANSTSIQVNVHGWRTVTGLPSGVGAEVNGASKLTHLWVNKQMNISAKTQTVIMNQDVLPVAYCPFNTVRANIRQDDECSVNYLGKIVYYCTVGLTSQWIQIDVTYKNKM